MAAISDFEKEKKHKTKAYDENTSFIINADNFRDPLEFYLVHGRR